MSGKIRSNLITRGNGPKITLAHTLNISRAYIQTKQIGLSFSHKPFVIECFSCQNRLLLHSIGISSHWKISTPCQSLTAVAAPMIHQLYTICSRIGWLSDRAISTPILLYFWFCERCTITYCFARHFLIKSYSANMFSLKRLDFLEIRHSNRSFHSFPPRLLAFLRNVEVFFWK